MVKGRQNLAFVAKAVEESARSALNEFDRDLLGVLAIGADRAINLTHASAPDLFRDLVGADPLPMSARRRCTCRLLKIDSRLVQESSSGLVVKRKKRPHFALQFGVLTECIDKGFTLSGFE